MCGWYVRRRCGREVAPAMAVMTAGLTGDGDGVYGDVAGGNMLTCCCCDSNCAGSVKAGCWNWSVMYCGEHSDDSGVEGNGEGSNANLNKQLIIQWIFIGFSFLFISFVEKKNTRHLSRSHLY